MLKDIWLPIALAVIAGLFALADKLFETREVKKAAAQSAAEKTVDKIWEGKLAIKDQEIKFRDDQLAAKDAMIRAQAETIAGQNQRAQAQDAKIDDLEEEVAELRKAPNG